MNSKERYNLNRIKKQLSSLIQIAAIKEIIKELDELLTDYQGWSNYETFVAANYIDNDKFKFEAALGAAKTFKVNSTNENRRAADIWSDTEYRKFELADYLELIVNIKEGENITSILADAAYGEINFTELADYYNQKIDEQQAA